MSSSFLIVWSSHGTQNRITVMSRLGIISPLSISWIVVLSAFTFVPMSLSSSCSLISSSFGGADLS